ncbi:MAG: DUF4430 domain-containing protein [Coriobacteriales bacterium]|jgi:hypothetical protein|nr:DUF4430 domain-containing protein [Coriobacteriales bacterium]
MKAVNQRLFAATLALVGLLFGLALAGCQGTSAGSGEQDPASASSGSTGSESTSTGSAGTGSEDASSASASEQITVTVVVECTAAVEGDFAAAKAITASGEIYNAPVTVDAGATVMDALQATDLVVGVQESSYGAYVDSIQSLKSGDCGAESGWVFTVNGEVVMEAAGDLILADGDVVQWSYVLSWE